MSARLRAEQDDANRNIPAGATVVSPEQMVALEAEGR